MDSKEFETKMLASLDRIIEMLEETNGRIPETSAPEAISNRECGGNSNGADLETRTQFEPSGRGTLGRSSYDGEGLHRNLRQEEESDSRNHTGPERPSREETKGGFGRSGRKA